MLEGLQEEISAHTEFVGASKQIIINALNEDGTAQVPASVTSDTPARLKKITFLSMLSSESTEKLITFMDSQPVFRLLFESGGAFDAAHPKFIEMIDLLADNSIISESEKTDVLRVGQRDLSRAEELFGRKITEEDFE